MFNNFYNEILNKFIQERIIFINGYIEDNIANIITKQLLYLESINSKDDIFLYINSPGGVISSGISIYDTMQYIKPNVNTLCMGQAFSLAAFLLAAGHPGKRFSLPNSRIMIHQPIASFQGQATDIYIQSKEILQIKNIVNKLMSKHTGKSIKKIEYDTERDLYLSAQEAKKYGIIDSILTKRGENE